MSRPAWLTHERLTLYPRALVFALAVAFALVVGLADGAQTVGGTLGGDYAAFHGAGTLVLEGHAERLYDPSAQLAVQRPFHPDEPGHYLYFAYPPLVALLYAPFAALGFVPGYALHTLLAALALGAAVRWMPRPPGLPAFALFAAALALYPMTRALFGGQNTSFTLLALVGAWVLTERQRPIAAGAVAALLLLKPQLGIPLLGLMALREPRTLLGAAPMALVQFAGSALVAGPGWITTWWSHVAWFRSMSDQVDTAQTVGLLTWTTALLGTGPLATGLGGLASGALVLALVVLWRHRTVPAGLRWPLTATGLVMLAPHSLFYDAGWSVLVIVALSTRIPSAAWLAMLGISWVGAAGPALGVNPLLPFMGAAAGLLLRAAQADQKRTAANA